MLFVAMCPGINDYGRADDEVEVYAYSGGESAEMGGFYMSPIFSPALC